MRRTGFTVVELLTGLSVMMFVILGSMAMLIYGVRFYTKTVSKTSLNTTNAQSLRKVTEAIRGATSISVSPDGTQLTFTLPRLTATNDPITGEKELVDPVVSDGVNRTYTVNFTAGTLTDPNGRVILKNVTRTDPDSSSSQYGQQYLPFQLTSIGSLRGVSINLITLEATASGTNYVRLKTTAVVRNAP